MFVLHKCIEIARTTGRLTALPEGQFIMSGVFKNIPSIIIAVCCVTGGR